MDKENLNYLKGIAERISDYDDIREYVLEYVLDNQIKDIELATNLFVAGFLWNASRREETLSTEELIMFLGSEEDYFNTDEIEPEAFALDPEEAELDLYELLKLTVDNFSLDE